MKIAILILPLLVTSCGEFNSENKPKTEPTYVWADSKPRSNLMYAEIDPFIDVDKLSTDGIKKLLREMYQIDQKYRDSIINGNKALQAHFKMKMGANDQANKILLDKILDKHGWPVISKFGADASNISWYVVWHQRDSERALSKYLGFMEVADSIDEMDHEQFELVKNQLAGLRSVGFSD